MNEVGSLSTLGPAWRGIDDYWMWVERPVTWEQKRRDQTRFED
jgi:hypothetical protein